MPVCFIYEVVFEYECGDAGAEEGLQHIGWARHWLALRVEGSVRQYRDASPALERLDCVEILVLPTDLGQASDLRASGAKGPLLRRLSRIG